MRNLTSSLAAKTTAAFLYAISVILSVSCAFGAAGAYTLGYYSGAVSQNVPEGYEKLCEFIHSMRVWFLVILAVSVALFIITLIFLMCSAGHKHGKEGVSTGFFSKIPLDIFTFGIGLIITLIAVIASDSSYYGVYNEDMVITVMLISLVTTLIALAVLAFLTNFAVRVKVGKWWRNSLIFIVLRFLWRVLSSAARLLSSSIRALPQTWQVALGYVGFWLCNLICLIFVFSYGTLALGVLMFIALNLSVGAVLILVANQMKILRSAAESLARGNFETKTDLSPLFWEFKKHGKDLNSIGDGMLLAIDERMKSERLKTELITNVSHDIKTPLTSIVNYVDLLKKSPENEKRAEYLEVLSRQSSRLRRLTEDLVEASKASTGNIPVDLRPTNLEEIINQALGEYAERLSAGRLEAVFTPPSPRVSVLADGRLLWRVMDNLLSNVCKYAQSGTRVYIDVTSGEGGALISVKNISRERLNINADELMERFIRGDSSRAGEGSGLGLNIAKSLTDLQNGKLSISVDGDLFKASVYLPRA